MKKHWLRILPLALVIGLLLTSCGGKDAVAPPFDPDATAKALMDSSAFTDALDTVDTDTACTLYGIDSGTVTNCVVYASLSAGAEEIAVMTLQDDAAAKTALDALNQRVADQTAALKDYQPDEVTKLEHSIVEQRGSSVLLVVASDAAAAQGIIDGLDA